MRFVFDGAFDRSRHFYGHGLQEIWLEVHCIPFAPRSRRKRGFSISRLRHAANSAGFFSGKTEAAIAGLDEIWNFAGVGSDDRVLQAKDSVMTRPNCSFQLGCVSEGSTSMSKALR